MSKSKIEWCTDVWNVSSGCTKVSAGCRECWAERMWKRLSAPNMPYHGRAFTDVRCHPERLEQPLHWKKPRRIFVASMSDLFHNDVTQNFIDMVFTVMALRPQHFFQNLTKRPERMREYIKNPKTPFRIQHAMDSIMVNKVSAIALGHIYKVASLVWPLPNVHLGVSVEDQQTADERIPILMQTPAAVRWISAEPLLNSIDLSQYQGLDWVVVGSETGPKRRETKLDWVRLIRDQCQAADVPFFLKQLHINGKKVGLPKLDGVCHDAYPQRG